VTRDHFSFLFYSFPFSPPFFSFLFLTDVEGHREGKKAEKNRGYPQVGANAHLQKKVQLVTPDDQIVGTSWYKKKQKKKKVTMPCRISLLELATLEWSESGVLRLAEELIELIMIRVRSNQPSSRKQ
jgi:hypothetical protein